MDSALLPTPQTATGTPVRAQQRKIERVKRGVLRPQADKEAGALRSRVSRSRAPRSSTPLSPQVPSDCQRQGLSWPSEYMATEQYDSQGRRVGGWCGGADEEGSAQPPEENLIVWGLPWVLLIKKKKKSLFKCKFVLALDGLAGGREAGRMQIQPWDPPSPHPALGWGPAPSS